MTTDQSDQPTTYVTQEMLDTKDVWSEPVVAPPVSISDIRKWAIAIYWPETPAKLFWDEDYAKTTRYGGIIAPQDFNPFAWPIDRPPRASRSSPRTVRASCCRAATLWPPRWRARSLHATPSSAGRSSTCQPNPSNHPRT